MNTISNMLYVDIPFIAYYLITMIIMYISIILYSNNILYYIVFSVIQASIKIIVILLFLTKALNIIIKYHKESLGVQYTNRALKNNNGYYLGNFYFKAFILLFDLNKM